MSNRVKIKPTPAPKGSGQVVIATIHAAEISPYYTTSLVGSLLSDRAQERRIVGWLTEWSSANVSAARNNLTSRFLAEHTAEWLWWIDSDMGWDHAALEQLLAVADPEKAPIVGGLCFGASHDVLWPTIYQFTKVNGQVTTMRMDDPPDSAMVQCAATGAAFLLIHRSALEKIRERAFNAVFPFFQETEMAGQPCGEDLTFCIRAGICDLPVHVYTAVEVAHHKSWLLTNDTYRAQRAALPAVS